MRKLFLTITTIFLLMIVLCVVSILTTNQKNLYDSFIKNNGINIERITDSSYRLTKFPKPTLIIDKILYDGKFEVKNLEVTFSLPSFIIFNPKISNIKAENVTAYLDNPDIGLVNHDELIVELLKNDSFLFDMKIDNLIVSESDGDIPFSIKNFTLQNATKVTSFSGEIDKTGMLSGSLKSKNGSFTFDLAIDNGSYLLEIEEVYKDNMLQSGKGSITHSKGKNKPLSNLPDINAPIVEVQDTSDKFNISFDIIPEENIVNLKNIILDTNVFKGSGEINLSKIFQDSSNINFEFSKFDASAFYGLSNQISYRLDLKNKNLRSNLFVKELVLDKKNSLNNITINASIENEKLHIKDISGDEIKANGIVSQNSFRSIFTGHIEFNHKNLNELIRLTSGNQLPIDTDKEIPFSLSSNVKLTSVDFALHDLLLKTPDSDLRGDISIKFIGDIPRSNANLKFTFIDIDNHNYPVLPNITQYIASLLNDSKQSDYLNKFIPIRKINNLGSYDIAIDKLLVNKELYNDIKFNLNVSPGEIVIEDFFIQNKEDWIDSTITLKADNIKPVLDIKVHNGSLGVSFLSPQSMLDLRNKILDYVDLKKIDISTNITVKKLYNDDFVLSKVNFYAKNDGNVISVSKFDTELLGGKVQSSGSILLDPYSLNFVYGINSAQISEVAKILPTNIVSNSGVFSASGMLSTRGDKLNEQLYNLYTKSDIVAKNIVLNNFSIDDFIQKINNNDYVADDLSNDIRTAMITGETKIPDIKSNIEITKGIITIPSIMFKTERSSASASAIINIYDFSIDLASIFSFYIASPNNSNTAKKNYEPTEMKVTAKGSIFSPSREADTKKIEKILKTD